MLWGFAPNDTFCPLIFSLAAIATMTQRTDNGFGRGTWSGTITADISSPPAPIVGDIVDSDEDYDITWTVVSYVVTINPVIEI